MASWVLVPCLAALRREFGLLAPERDKTSDGSIGDTAHSQASSDHNPDETGRTPDEDPDRVNEVHAIDVDKDLRRTGVTMEQCVQEVVRRHRIGLDSRLQNVIYDGRIWSESWGWSQRPYGGPNPHDKHAHFSSRYTTAAEADTRPWGLLTAFGGDDMTADQLLALLNDDRVEAKVRQLAGQGVHAQEIGRSGRTFGQVAERLDNYIAVPPDSADEAAIIAGVLAGLDPAAIAAAIPEAIAAQVADLLAARLAA